MLNMRNMLNMLNIIFFLISFKPWVKVVDCVAKFSNSLALRQEYEYKIMH